MSWQCLEDKFHIYTGNAYQFVLFYFSADDKVLQCHDWKGNVVAFGQRYTPSKDDPCGRCTCHEQGFPVMCSSVQCSPPAHCMKWELLPGECCKHNCLLPADLPRNETGDSTMGSPTSEFSRELIFETNNQ